MNPAETQDALTYQIIGAAMEVHKILGPGLLESVYEDALCVELEQRNLRYEQQKPISIDYKGRNVGDLFADIIVENRVIVELKSVDHLAPIHSAQIMTYLKLTNLKIGLLINFNVPVVKNGIKRFIL